MPFVRTLEGFTPPERYDGIPWNAALIQESADASVWTTIDTQALSPVDPDPSAPQARNFTTDDATLEDAWYRIVWRDANTATYTGQAVYFPGTQVLYVTSSQIRQWSKMEFADLGYEEADPDPLDLFIGRAGAFIIQVTGVDLGAIPANDNRVALTQECIQLLVEYQVARAQSEVAETYGDFDLIKSFTAGSYTETRRGPNESRNALHPIPRIATLLNMIAGGDGRGILMDAPAVGAPEPDWDVGKGIIDAKRSRVLTPFGPPNPPWDSI